MTMFEGHRVYENQNMAVNKQTDRGRTERWKHQHQMGNYVLMIASRFDKKLISSGLPK